MSKLFLVLLVIVVSGEIDTFFLCVCIKFWLHSEKNQFCFSVRCHVIVLVVYTTKIFLFQPCFYRDEAKLINNEVNLKMWKYLG